MRKYLLLILMSLGLLETYGQQRSQYSNYVMNNYLLNPAVGGSYTFFNVKVGHREQWLGMEGAPRTSFVSIHGPINHPDARKRTLRYKKTTHHGLGAYAYSDEIGPLSWRGAFASYAYHIRVSRKVTTSFGIFGGLKEFRVDGDKIKFVEHPTDEIVKPGVQSTIMPDANVGWFMYADRFFAGISVNQILQTSLDFETKDGTTAEGKLNNHYFITGGYKWSIDRDWHFYPTVLIKAMYPAPATFDVNLRIMYSDFAWVGLTYRNGDIRNLFEGDAVSFMAEYVFNDTFEVGYAYDYGVSELNAYNDGTHEIIFGIRWNDPKKEIRCPAKFW